MKKENFFGYDKYSLSCGDMELSVITLGATVTSLKYKGRELALSYADAQGYLDDKAFVCAAIGRYANRIGDSRFTIDGKEYLLVPNEGKNQLHSGPKAVDKRTWKAEKLSETALRMSILSPDGDNGFPGNLTMSVTYTLEEKALRMDFAASSDADTHFAPTSHMYFDLGGKGRVLEHEMQINAEGWLEVDEGLIPTGKLMPAEGDFDFSALRKVGRDYDHCFVLASQHACTLQAGGICMDLYTDMPAMQLYTASAMGEPLGVNSGLAIEPEFLPDSPNKPQFPSTLLKAGETNQSWARFVFSDC